MKVQCPVFFVTGATGTGKSSLAIEVAETLKSEHRYDEVVIINCDVMQFYKDLPIATNKVTGKDAHRIPHTFIGFLESDDSRCASPTRGYRSPPEAAKVADELVPAEGGSGPFTVHVYLGLVTAFIESFFKRYSNGAIIVCGGTCYYLQSVLFTNTLVDEDISLESSLASEEGRPGDTDVSKRPTDGEEDDAQSLWARLNDIDPASAQRYHPHDTRRVRRLLTIYEQKGVPPSSLFAARKVSLRFPPERTFIVWTYMDRTSLNAQLRGRVDAMCAQGLLAEVRNFRKKLSGTESLGAIKEAIGLREFAGLTDSALETEDSVQVADAIEKVKADTIRYARKQERWIRNRITESLRRASPPLPICHFVRVNLDNGAQLSKVAVDIVGGFFANRDPHDSPLISFPLSAGCAPKPVVSQAFCPLCDMIVCGRGQMEVHVRSKRHRGAIRRQQLEKEQLEKYGRVLPPQRRRVEK